MSIHGLHPFSLFSSSSTPVQPPAEKKNGKVKGVRLKDTAIYSTTRLTQKTARATTRFTSHLFESLDLSSLLECFKAMRFGSRMLSATIFIRDKLQGKVKKAKGTLSVDTCLKPKIIRPLVKNLQNMVALVAVPIIATVHFKDYLAPLIPCTFLLNLLPDQNPMILLAVRVAPIAFLVLDLGYSTIKEIRRSISSQNSLEKFFNSKATNETPSLETAQGRLQDCKNRTAQWNTRKGICCAIRLLIQGAEAILPSSITVFSPLLKLPLALTAATNRYFKPNKTEKGAIKAAVKAEKAKAPPKVKEAKHTPLPVRIGRGVLLVVALLCIYANMMQFFALRNNHS